MRTSSAARAALVIYVSLTAAATSASGAPGSQDQAPTAEQTRDDGLFAAPPVTDAPFSAEAVTTWKPPADSGRPALSSTLRMYRDRAGRVRVEQTFAGHPPAQGPQRIFVLPDPQSRLGFRLDPSARTAMEIAAGLANMSVTSPDSWVVPVSMRCQISYPQPQAIQRRLNGASEEEALGQRLVLGVPAVGTRFAATSMSPDNSAPREMSDERWVSPALGIVLHSRSEDPAIGVVEHQVTRLSLVDPSPRLFDLPADYRLAEPEWHPIPNAGPGREPSGWENPHALLTWRKAAAPCDVLPH